jgi:hypothetical protein
MKILKELKSLSTQECGKKPCGPCPMKNIGSRLNFKYNCFAKKLKLEQSCPCNECLIKIVCTNYCNVTQYYLQKAYETLKRKGQI